MKDIYRYGSEVNSHDLLKISGILTMVIDHIGRFYLANNIWFRIIGRMAAPQFFFLVGYSGSYRFKRDILFYGVALSIVHYLTSTSTSIMEQALPLNILVSFTIIKALLNKSDPIKLSSGALIILLAVLMFLSLPTYLFIEYGTLGLCYAIGARLLRQRHSLRRFWLCATVFIHFFFEFTFLLVLNADVSVQSLPFTAGLLVVVFLANLIVFINYDFRLFKIQHKYIRTVAIYVSRYSLEIYFFHLSAFMIATYIWNPVL
jgi:hypothetical protein